MQRTMLLCFFLITSLSFGQKKLNPSPEEITQAKALREVHPDEDIVILDQSEKITFGRDKKSKKVNVYHNVSEEMMNINTRADIQKFIIYNGESSIESFTIKYKNKKDAYVKFNDEAISDDDMFHHDMRVKYANVDFPLQGYKYFTNTRKKTKDIKYFTSVYFAGKYRSLQKTISFIIPDWLDLELKEINFEGYDINKTSNYDKKLKATVITYTIKDIQGRYDEKKSPGPSYIYPHVLVLAKSYEYNGKTTTLFKDTKDLYKWYRSLVKSMKEQPDHLKSKVTELIKDAKTDEEKIKNIYYWVQDNIRYIAFEDGIAGFKPDESQNVFKKRYGDCKGMANLTKQMLKHAGFDARLTWIGTKRIAYDYSTPNLSVDNHMICTLFKDGKKIYLDGTEKFNAFGEYAERIQGKQVLIEDGDSFLLETVPSSQSIDNLETYTFNAKIEDNALVGLASKSFDGESRASFLYYYNNLQNDEKEDALVYYLNNDDKNLKVSNIETSDIHNREQQLSIQYQLSQKNAVSSFDNEIYIDLDYEKEFGRFLFEERQTDYIFSFKKHFESKIVLEIPSGYSINTLPESLHIDTDNYKIQVQFEQTGNTLTYSKAFVLKNAILKTSDFETWNDTIKVLQSIYDEQIILTKTP
jgi:hypothetical protein